jgi:transposase-like protein
MAVDWAKIKTEYVTDPNATYRELSKKYGVHYTNIAKKAKKEDWQQLRQQHINKVQTKAQTAVERKQVRRASRIDEAADMLLDKVMEFMAASEDMMVNTQSMKHISGVLKDIKEIKGIKSEADMQEQEARIAKLRREAEANDALREPVRVVMEGDLEDYSE